MHKTQIFLEKIEDIKQWNIMKALSLTEGLHCDGRFQDVPGCHGKRLATLDSNLLTQQLIVLYSIWRFSKSAAITSPMRVDLVVIISLSVVTTTTRHVANLLISYPSHGYIRQCKKMQRSHIPPQASTQSTIKPR